METQNPNPELLKTIKEKLKKETPRTRRYARLISIARVGILTALVLVSTLTLSLFSSDILEKFQGGELENHSLLENTLGFLFEFLIITIIGVVAIYLIYRKTDWPLVKEKLRLVIYAFLVIAILSVGLVTLSESETTALGDFLDGFKDRIEDSLPFRVKTWLENDPGKQIYMLEGTMTSIEPDGRDWIIIVESPEETVRLTLERRFGVFAAGDKVRLEYEVDGNERDVERIEKR